MPKQQATLPRELQAILDARTPKQQAALDKTVRGRQATGGGVPICCTTNEAGEEVCIAVMSALECPATADFRSCSAGQSNRDGTVTCFDDAGEDDPG